MRGRCKELVQAGEEATSSTVAARCGRCLAPVLLPQRSLHPRLGCKHLD